MDSKTETVSDNAIKEGDLVCFKIDLRGFLAYYEVICVKNGNALIAKKHLWRTDPYEETWQPIEALKRY